MSKLKEIVKKLESEYAVRPDTEQEYNNVYSDMMNLVNMVVNLEHDNIMLEQDNMRLKKDIEVHKENYQWLEKKTEDWMRRAIEK